MAQVKQTALDREIKRWARPDWRHFWKSGRESDPLYRLYESVEHKYSPDQPRVPAGVPEGGQWTAEGGAGGRGPVSDGTPRDQGKPATQIAGRILPQRRAECEEQLRKDTFICNTVRTRSCWAQANFRHSQCLIGGYVPPIYH
jgi:hypothetical protein